MEALSVIVSFLTFIAIIFFILIRLKKAQEDLEIEVLNEKWEAWRWSLNALKLPRKKLKSEFKKYKKTLKTKEESETKTLYVLQFEGDLRASGVSSLRQEVTAILQACNPSHDEVLICISSGGGTVQDYGLAASQLKRITNRNISLTVAIDTVAASGGYLMSCVANRIIASPFAIVGSIGVVAQFPNFHRLLKKWDIDYKEYTAGEFKRTVTLLGEIQPKGEQKFLEQLEETHQFFKQFVQTHRPLININSLATGEYWYGQKAKELGLVDDILTSDEFMQQKAHEGYQVVSIKHKIKKPWPQRISESALTALEQKIVSWLSRKV